ncbi:MAG: SDR family NAD(P)-dependent oxidoreductase [Mycoplasmatales bacterium]
MKKYVLITGAASGIGFATALAYADKQMSIIAVDKNSSGLYNLETQIKMQNGDEVDVRLITVDLTDERALMEFYLETQNYRIKTWINCAGVGIIEKLVTISAERQLELNKLNVQALSFLSIRYVQDYFTDEDATLINISSGLGYRILETMVSYCASKYYVSSFTEGLAQTLRLEGGKMRVKVMAPTLVESPFTKTALNAEEYDFSLETRNYNSTAEIAQYILKLEASDKIVGTVNRQTLELILEDPLLPYQQVSGDTS